MSYEKQNENWQSGDTVTEANFDAWETAIYELKHTAVDAGGFGAVGDGVTNDTAAIQSAIDTAAAEATATRPQAVKFPEGTYKVVPTVGNFSNNVFYGIRLKANVHLFGEGGAVIYYPYVGTFSPDAETCMLATGIDNFSISNMVFDGGATTTTTEEVHFGIYCVNDCNDFRIVDNEMFGAQGKSIHVNGSSSACERFWIADNYIHHQGHGNAIGYNGTCNEYFIIRNLCVDPYAAGVAEAIIADSGTHTRAYIGQNVVRAWGDIQLPGLTDSRVVGNTVIMEGASAAMKVSSFSLTRTLIADNYLDVSANSGSDNYCIKISESGTVLTDVAISRNICRLPSANAGGILLAIFAGGSTNVLIDSNVIFGGTSSQEAFHASNVEGLLVRGNLFGRMATVGDTCSSAMVTNNLLTGVGSVLRCDAPDSLVSGNMIASGNTADGSYGLYVVGDESQVVGNQVYHQAGNGSAAIRVDASDCLISGNHVEHSANNGQCITEGSENNNLITGNYVKAPGTPQITKSGAATRVRNNFGWITENKGATSVQNTNTISHGLSATPTSVRLTSSVAKHIATVTALATGTFTVGLHDDTGTAVTTPEVVYWEAEV